LLNGEVQMKRIVMALVLAGVVGGVVGPSDASAATYRRSGPGPVVRFFGTRLYYSNAFRGLIPGTGIGGFRRPAFGYRGY
jgi:hypothetical protein